jgi:hypothetical protein
MGSVVFISSSIPLLQIRFRSIPLRAVSEAALPTRFLDAGYLALQGQRPEAQAADLELPQKRARPPAEPAAIVLPDAFYSPVDVVRELRPLLGLSNTGSFCHFFALLPCA